ncbi:MAG: hypothetical protein K9J17_14305 [Flavobacteriales bacterium]|nr:hypothetical protein [Flavobacteriales bacterium]
MNKRLVFMILACVFVVMSVHVSAQTPPPSGPVNSSAPLDALAGVLLIIGAATGGWNLRKKAK